MVKLSMNNLKGNKMRNEQIKKDKFVELIERRVNSCTNQMRLIGNLANQHLYSYTDLEIDLIETHLEEQLKKNIDQLRARRITRPDLFDFEEGE
tara:strand:+ start:403 stop:684 length:282 start_codon:yes stop_codon:yes gene_type:complete